MHGDPTHLVPAGLPPVDGLVLSAQSWRHKDREGRLRSNLPSDEHAPAQYRVNACIRNDDGWHAAFPVPPGSRHYLAPQERVRLW